MAPLLLYVLINTCMVTFMLLWAGLGNPSEKYKNQRHNIGFMIVDKIAIEYSFSPWRDKMNACICEGEIEGHKVLLAKPQSFMNNSGTPLSQIARFFKILDSSVYVFHDDIDLKTGQVKVKMVAAMEVITVCVILTHTWVKIIGVFA